MNTIIAKAKKWEIEFDNLFRFQDKYTLGEIKDFIASLLQAHLQANEILWKKELIKKFRKQIPKGATNTSMWIDEICDLLK